MPHGALLPAAADMPLPPPGLQQAICRYPIGHAGALHLRGDGSGLYPLSTAVWLLRPVGRVVAVDRVDAAIGEEAPPPHPPPDRCCPTMRSNAYAGFRATERVLAPSKTVVSAVAVTVTLLPASVAAAGDAAAVATPVEPPPHGGGDPPMPPLRSVW